MKKSETTKKRDKTVKSDEHLQEQSVQYFSFHLGKEIYAIEVDYIREVIEYEAVYFVPLVPSYIAGVMNLRGEVIPVIDLAQHFFGKSNELTRFTCIIIVEILEKGESKEIGVIIDSLNAVIDLTDSQIKRTPDFGLNIRPDFVKGIGNINDDMILLLNIQRVLNIDELSNF